MKIDLIWEKLRLRLSENEVRVDERKCCIALGLRKLGELLIRLWLNEDEFVEFGLLNIVMVDRKKERELDAWHWVGKLRTFSHDLFVSFCNMLEYIPLVARNYSAVATIPRKTTSST